MRLTKIAIRNFRSVEEAELRDPGTLAVLVGRNNAGKSSVFGAIEAVGSHARGGGYDFTGAITNDDPERSFGLSVEFVLNEGERRAVLSTLRLSEPRRAELLESPFARHLALDFRTPRGRPDLPHLREMRVRAADSNWATISSIIGRDDTNNPTHNFYDFSSVVDTAALSAEQLNVDRGSFQANIDVSMAVNQTLEGGQRASSLFIDMAHRYFAQTFFFSPFRHATAQLPAVETARLSATGDNLAQVLHTLRAGDSDTFERIQLFVEDAVSGIGRLQTPLRQGSTFVGFRQQSMNDPIPVTRMGGGIEQLLMIATVLETTGSDFTLFLEEPESHLHPGAQRYLLDRVDDGRRQVFISTHSPVFLDRSRASRVFRVELIDGRSHIASANDALAAGSALEDIGARRSDVLLSDAVLFVEGPGDRDVLAEWAGRAGIDLSAGNVSVLSLGGSEHAIRHAPMRSDLLHALSSGSPIPHMFVLDRDERSDAEIASLRRRLRGVVTFLRGREVENYVLNESAILAAMRAKHPEKGDQFEQLTESQVAASIDRAADALYGIVLLKRVRARLPGISGGMLDRESVLRLARHAHASDLASRVGATIDQRLARGRPRRLAPIIDAERRRLQRQWIEPANRRRLAPGSEILTTVFGEHGLVFRKPDDTVRIAKLMPDSHIPSEILAILRRAEQMPRHR